MRSFVSGYEMHLTDTYGYAHKMDLILQKSTRNDFEVQIDILTVNSSAPLARVHLDADAVRVAREFDALEGGGGGARREARE